MSPLLSNRMYDILRWLVTILLPALGAAYFTLGNLWEFPNIERVAGTILVVEIFLGALIGISNSQYKKAEEVREKVQPPYDGNLHVDTRDPEVDRWTVETTTPLDVLDKKAEAKFRIIRHDNGIDFE